MINKKHKYSLIKRHEKTKTLNSVLTEQSKDLLEEIDKQIDEEIKNVDTPNEFDDDFQILTKYDYVESHDFTEDGVGPDLSFNFYNGKKFFEASEYFHFAFYEFESQINGLYFYFRYLLRYIEHFKKSLAAQVNNIYKSSGASMGFFDDDLDVAGDLNEIHLESIIVELYRVFELFLMNFIKEESGSGSLFDVPEYTGKAYPFMKYLHYDIDIFVPKTLYYKFNTFRIVRNYIVHGNEEIRGKLVDYLEMSNTDILKDNKIAITPAYVEESFENIGEIVKCIENSYYSLPRGIKY